jgi:hypothetical protein
LSKACKLLLSDGICDINEEVVADLERKHPPRFKGFTGSSVDVQGIQVIAAEVLRQLESFPKDSSAGPSQLSPQLLLDAVKCRSSFKSQEVLFALTSLVNLFASGGASKEIAPFFCGATLIPTKKKTGGVRPIAVGETLRRLVCKCLSAAVLADCTPFLLPFQVGVGVQGGADAAVHAVRTIVSRNERSSDMVLLKMDFENAFNMMSRQEIIEVVVSRCPGLLPWTIFSLEPDSILYLDSAHQILSRRGVQQGDPLGPLLFSLALHSVPLAVHDKCPSVFQIWYLDDALLIGKESEIRIALDCVRSEAAAIGMRLNLDKCELWWPSSRPWRSLPKEIIRVSDSGVEFLGCGVGAPEFSRGLLQKKVEAVRTLQQRILLLEDSQMELCLLRSCASSCKISNMLRCCDPRDFLNLLESFDQSLLTTLENILAYPLSPSACKQVVLPVSLGGLGLTSSSATCFAAFLGSINKTRDLISLLLRNHGSWGDVPGLDFVKSLFPGESDWSQAHLTAKVHGKLHDGLLDFSSPSEKARLLSLSAKHASAWLLAIPSAALGLKFTNDQFRCLLRLTLGLQIYPVQRQCPSCRSAPLDIHGNHSLMCASGGDRISRHNVLRDCLFSLCQSAGLSPRKEEQHPDDLSRPGDVFLPIWSLGRPAALDISVTHPLQAATVIQAAGTGGFAATQRVIAKTTRYSEACATFGIDFIPIVFETFGALGDVSLECLKKIAKMWGNNLSLSPSRAVSFFFQSLSVSLQRGNAEMILRRSPPSHLSL